MGNTYVSDDVIDGLVKLQNNVGDCLGAVGSLLDRDGIESKLREGCDRENVRILFSELNYAFRNLVAAEEQLSRAIEVLEGDYDG